MVSEQNWIPMDDGTRLQLRRWRNTAPKAILHIVHGMAEHSQRYASLAQCLNKEGIEVWAADQRGHGETAGNKENDPGRGGLLGHCADGDGFFRVTKDIDILNKAIMKEYPGIPLFLMGHSWGSFITQSYIENFNTPLAGCILAGTRGPDGLKISIGARVMDFLTFLGNERKGSRAAKALADGPNNKAFKPNRTEFDWLSRDEKEVDTYITDPLCGFLCSLGFYRDMTRALKQIHKPENMRKIRKELPVYIIFGSADPVGDMGLSPAALVVSYKHLGITNLESVIYPDARHELFNETNREEVITSLISWLLRHCH